MPDSVTGHDRYYLLQSFWAWKGPLYVPKDVHPSIVWTEDDSPDQYLPQYRYKFCIVKTKKDKKDKDKGYEMVPAKGSLPAQVNPHTIDNDEPLGIIWDNVNYSCGYDAILVILFELWRHKQSVWQRCFSIRHNPKLTNIIKLFTYVKFGRSTMEDVQRQLRPIMHAENPREFPMGNGLADVCNIAGRILGPGVEFNWPNNCILTCARCNKTMSSNFDAIWNVLFNVRLADISTQDVLNTSLNLYARRQECSTRACRVRQRACPFYASERN